MSTPSVDEGRTEGPDEESLVEGVRSALMGRPNLFGPIPGISSLLVENMKPGDDGRTQFAFRGPSGVSFVDTVERFERDWLVDHVVLAGGGPHVRVRISVRRIGMDGPWDCYFWVPGADAGDASARLLASSVIES